MKTRDGIKIGRVISSLEKLKGVRIRPGKNHPFVAIKDGYKMTCPIAESTDVKRMIVPWIKQAFGYSDSMGIYNALRNGLCYGGKN